MSKKLVVRIANGLGNQLFIYASAYAFAKQLNRELLIDEKSGFLNEERKIKYELSYFNISSKISGNEYKFDNQLKNTKRFLLFIRRRWHRFGLFGTGWSRMYFSNS